MLFKDFLALLCICGSMTSLGLTHSRNPIFPASPMNEKSSPGVPQSWPTDSPATCPEPQYKVTDFGEQSFQIQGLVASDTHCSGATSPPNVDFLLAEEWKT